MSAAILAKLPLLRKESGKYLLNSTVIGLTDAFSAHGNKGIQLKQTIYRQGKGLIGVPTGGWDDIEKKLQRVRKVRTLEDDTINTHTKYLNDELKGGDSYPVLVAVMGGLVGLVPVVGTTAGLLFAATTTAVDVSKPDHRVLARRGDEIWAVEAIGKRPNFFGTGHYPVHVMSLWIVDPYRTDKNTPAKGWLIHEKHSELSFD